MALSFAARRGLAESVRRHWGSFEMGARCALLRRQRLAQAEGHVDGVDDEEDEEDADVPCEGGEREGEDGWVHDDARYADGVGVLDVSDEDEYEEVEFGGA